MKKKVSADHAKFREEWEDAVYAWPTGKDKEGKKFSAIHKVVLLCLIRYRNRDTGDTWVSSGTLANAAGVSKSTAQEALQRAGKNGFLETTTSGTGGAVGSKNRTSVRLFTIPEVSTGADSQGSTGVDSYEDEGSTGTDPRVHGYGPLRVHGCGPKGPQVRDLTPERTPEKEPLNRTPEKKDVEGNLAVVDAEEFDGDFSEEDPVPLDEWRAATGLFTEPSFGIPVLEEEPPLPPEPVDEEPSVLSGPF